MRNNVAFALDEEGNEFFNFLNVDLDCVSCILWEKGRGLVIGFHLQNDRLSNTQVR